MSLNPTQLGDGNEGGGEGNEGGGEGNEGGGEGNKGGGEGGEGNEGGGEGAPGVEKNFSRLTSSCVWRSLGTFFGVSNFFAYSSVYFLHFSLYTTTVT